MFRPLKYSFRKGGREVRKNSPSRRVMRALEQFTLLIFWHNYSGFSTAGCIISLCDRFSPVKKKLTTIKPTLHVLSCHATQHGETNYSVVGSDLKLKNRVQRYYRS